jgi:hypothetical protein
MKLYNYINIIYFVNFNCTISSNYFMKGGHNNLNKYKEDFYIYKQKDSDGNYTSNKDDNYIKAKNGIQIYRYNENTLAVQFNSTGIANNRIKELSALGVQLTSFQIGDNESTYKFSESDFPIIADIIKAKKRIKRDLTDEQKEVIKERLKNSRKK